MAKLRQVHPSSHTALPVRWRLVRLLTLAAVLWVLSLKTVAESPVTPAIDSVAQEQTWQLLQKVIAEYWHGEKLDVATNKAGDTNVEMAFRAASKLMPERLDLRFGLASAVLSQAVGTNGQQLQIKAKEALAIYREIQTVATNGFDAPLLLAAYSRALGDTNACRQLLERLELTYPERTRQYAQTFDRIDGILCLVPNEMPWRSAAPGSHHAIVVLGAGLETNGALKEKLISRLERCRKLSRMYPDSPIILTGGNPKAGITEAYAMRNWCLRKRIPKKRLVLEDKARDTVENAIFTSEILQKLGITEVTLVTSLSHMRRGLADFDEACRQRGLAIRFDHLASRTKGELELNQEQERLGVYRDVLRTSGLWAFPGIQR